MKFPRWVMVVVVAFVAIGALAVERAWQRGGTERASASFEHVTMSLDCSPASGVQTNCTFPTGTTSIPVELAITNSLEPFRFGTMNAIVLGFEMVAFAPGVPAVEPPIHSPQWDCDNPSPSPDLNLDFDPLTAHSYLKCSYGNGTGPLLLTGESVSLASIVYTASGDGVHSLKLFDADVIDWLDTNMGHCGTWDFFDLDTAICPITIVQIGTGSTATPTFTPTNTPTPMPTFTPTSTFTAIPTPTPCSGSFDDLDGIPFCSDNCPFDANPGQENTADRNFIDTSPPYVAAIDDRTWPMSDAVGDICDGDDDNDGMSDIDEPTGSACSGVATNPLMFDSDGDRARDGAECSIGTNPSSSASFPPLSACGASGDADADKVSNRVEFCYYGTSNASIDSDGDAPGGLDGDGGKDGCEVASINADQVVSSGDQGKLASGITGATPYHSGVDLNKDGILNSGDQGLMGSLISPPGQCP